MVNQNILGEFPPQFENVWVNESTHFYEIITLATDHDLTIIPVVNQLEEFIGSVNIHDTAVKLSKVFAGNIKGGVFVLKVDARNYSLSEISRLVETNNARVLSSFLEPHEEELDKLKVTVKVNIQDLTRILATFERFGYQVVAKYNDVEAYNLASERLNMLFKFLEI